MDSPYHIPALLEEAIEGLDIKPDGIYVDATFGGGGHSTAIIDRLSEKGRLFGFDQDSEAKANSLDRKNFTFVHSNFKYIRNFLKYYGIRKVDGILADIGVSFHHFDATERGFSFRSDVPLDMRMNTSALKNAETILNTASADELCHMFKVYGEVDNAKKIADKIIGERTATRITTTKQLADIISPLIDPRREKKEMAKIFQAVRIAVNKELEALEALLGESVEILNPGGRLAIISYHSLEDRMVKNFMKTGNLEGMTQTDMFGRNLSPFKLITSKPITPSEREIRENPRSRSAKLRIAVRK